MKKAFVLATALIFAFSTFALALDLVMDAEKDAFYETLTGPEDGWIHLGLEAQGIDQGGADDEFDINALVWFAWDSTYFYCYTEIVDEEIVVNNATQYENDAVELKIDPDPSLSTETTAGVAAYRLSAWGEDAAEVPEGVHNLNSGEAGGPADWEPVEGEDYARKEVFTDQRAGYNLELRIPFENIVTTDGSRAAFGEVGWIIGLAVNVMDNDEGQRDHVLRWASNMADQVWNDPWRHGTVTFLEGNKVNMSTENAITFIDTNSVDYSIPEGTSVASDIEAPVEFELAQNYPNPFNPSTNIAFALPKAQNVTLDVYNLLGVKVASLISNQVMQAGVHNITFNASELNSGVYLYQLQAGANVMTKKMMFIK